MAPEIHHRRPIAEPYRCPHRDGYKPSFRWATAALAGAQTLDRDRVKTRSIRRSASERALDGAARLQSRLEAAPGRRLGRVPPRRPNGFLGSRHVRPLLFGGRASPADRRSRCLHG